LAIGITGGIACGKSEVGRILGDGGVAVLDADEVAHKVIAPGGPVYDKVVESFGERILKESGEIDRAVLGKIVFADETKRSLLNNLVHPDVCRECRRWVDEATGEGKTAAVIMPLLFEIEETEPWDLVVCVAASDDIVRERLKRRGLSEEDIAARMAAQMPVEQKAERADFVIRNEGDMEDLRNETISVLKTIMKERSDHDSTRR
jgi:dephospho-CoA kinase